MIPRRIRPLGALALCALLAMLVPGQPSRAQEPAEVSVDVPPPDLPVTDQPPLPGDGYVWTPGYWAWSPDEQDYYWVPGAWVPAPQPDYLWTPGYWGVSGAAFVWYPGYWGPRVGFYGGVDYGYGYGGRGYEGAHWQDGHLFYNRSANNFGDARVTNVYNQPIYNVAVNRVSYNGGDGIQAQPSAEERAAQRDRHLPPTAVQQQHVLKARSDPAEHYNRNQGRPPVAAAARPGRAAEAPAAATGRAPSAAERPTRAAAPRPAPTPAPPREAPPRPVAPPHEGATHDIAPRESAPREAAPREAAPRDAGPRAAPPHPAEPHPPARPPEPHPENREPPR